MQDDASRTSDVLGFLRALSTADIARMAWMILPAALVGEAGNGTLELLRMMGVVLKEREATDRKRAA